MPLALPDARARSGIDAEALIIAAFCLLWSSAFAVSKVALADCPPLLLLTIRFLIAGAITLAGAAVFYREWRIGWRGLLVLVVIGIANNALYLGFSYSGMHTVSAGLTALIVSTNPVFTSLLSSWFLDERITSRRVSGLALGVRGVAFIVESRVASGAASWLGIGLIVAALISLVSGTILFKRFAPSGNLVIGNGVPTLASGFALAPVAFTFERIGEIVPTWHLVAAIAYLVLCASVVGYLLWFHLLTEFGATAASAYHFLMPPLGMLFGWALLGEHVEIRDLLGILPVAVGIYLVTRPSHKRR